VQSELCKINYRPRAEQVCCLSLGSFELRNLAVAEQSATISIKDFQALIRQMYFEKDLARGVDGTFMWLMEEVGELAAALREGTREERLHVRRRRETLKTSVAGCDA